MAISDKPFTYEELKAKLVLESYRTRNHKIEKRIDKIARLKIKSQETSGSFIKVSGGSSVFIHTDKMRENVIKAVDLEITAEKVKKENNAFLKRVRYVIEQVKGIDFNLGYILKRYYIDYDYPPITLIAQELGYCDKTIVRKRNDAIKLFAKLYI